LRLGGGPSGLSAAMLHRQYSMLRSRLPRHIPSEVKKTSTADENVELSVGVGGYIKMRPFFMRLAMSSEALGSGALAQFVTLDSTSTSRCTTPSL